MKYIILLIVPDYLFTDKIHPPLFMHEDFNDSMSYS